MTTPTPCDLVMKGGVTSGIVYPRLVTRLSHRHRFVRIGGASAGAIAAAFTATIYGIASANLFFLPIASKLKSVIGGRSREQEMIIEGLIAIAQGENPRNIEAKLAGFLH